MYFYLPETNGEILGEIVAIFSKAHEVMVSPNTFRGFTIPTTFLLMSIRALVSVRRRIITLSIDTVACKSGDKIVERYDTSVERSFRISEVRGVGTSSKRADQRITLLRPMYEGVQGSPTASDVTDKILGAVRSHCVFGDAALVDVTFGFLISSSQPKISVDIPGVDLVNTYL